MISMNITVINGSEDLGAAAALKERFLAHFSATSEIKQWFMPQDLPNFCRGCEICVTDSETKCRDARFFMPLWKSLIAADLIVIVTPTYGNGIPSSLKNLFDHFEWAAMPHRPRAAMFGKPAVILAAGRNGQDCQSAVKYIKAAVGRWGISAAAYVEVTDGRRNGSAFDFEKLMTAVNSRSKTPFALKRKFKACRAMRKKIIEAEKASGELSADSRYWTGNDLLTRNPWKNR